MRQSGLEKDKITLRDIFEEIKHVGLGHYLDDLTGRIMDGTSMHYHKMNHTSKDNHVLHSYFPPRKNIVSDAYIPDLDE